MSTDPVPEAPDDLSGGAAFPGPGSSPGTGAIRACVRCGIETTEATCFICGQPTRPAYEYDWAKNPNPSGSDC